MTSPLPPRATSAPCKARRRLAAVLTLLALLSLAAAASADEVTWLLETPRTSIAPQSQASIWLYCMNESSHEVTETFEPSLSAVLASASGADTLRLTLAPESDPHCVISPGGFAKREYRFEVPVNLEGSISLSVANMNPQSVRVAAPARSPAPAEPGVQVPTPPETRPLFGRFLNSRITPYEPIFFILGTHPSAEFQFSLKASLFDPAHVAEPLSDLYFGYTQTSFWDLLTADPSFYDTSYKPSLFYYKPNFRIPDFTGKSTRLDLQYGYEHESNGDGGAMERSLNTLYFQPTLTFGEPTGLRFTVQPRVSYYLSLGRNNPDLKAYRGYANLHADLTWKVYQLATRLDVGDRGTHGSMLVDLRAGLGYFNLDPSFQLEYFTGYVENLRDYNKRDTGLRAGFCLWYPKFDGK